MRASLGQVVYLFKYRLVRDGTGTKRHTPSMAVRKPKERNVAVEFPGQHWIAPSPSLFGQVLRARIKAAREAAGLTQDQVADRLGIKQWKYAKYETRSALPHIYMTRFCEITRISLASLLKDPR